MSYIKRIVIVALTIVAVCIFGLLFLVWLVRFEIDHGVHLQICNGTRNTIRIDNLVANGDYIDSGVIIAPGEFRLISFIDTNKTIKLLLRYDNKTSDCTLRDNDKRGCIYDVFVGDNGLSCDSCIEF